MYCVLCTVYCVLCTVYCVLCTVYCVLCTVYCVLCTVYCVLCTVYCVLCTVYCVLCTVYCVLCTVYCVLCTVYCVLCTVYWSHFKLTSTPLKWSIFFVVKSGELGNPLPLVFEFFYVCPKAENFRLPNLQSSPGDKSIFEKNLKKKNPNFFFTSVFEACSLHPRHPSGTKKSKKARIGLF